MGLQTDARHTHRSAERPDRLCAVCGLSDCSFRRRVLQFGALKVHPLERGQSLQCPEASCLRFWIVVKGYAATCTYFRDGRRQILSIEEPGAAICGPMAPEDSEQRVEALNDCVICEIDLTARAAELRDDAAFLTDVSRMLHDRLEKSAVHVAMLGRLDSFERVTFFLADLAVRQARRGLPATLPMSREDIADFLGLNTDSVSRILTRIRKSGLIRFVSPTEYFVPDSAALARRLPVAMPDAERTTSFIGETAQ